MYPHFRFAGNKPCSLSNTDMGPVPRGTPGMCMKDCMKDVHERLHTIQIHRCECPSHFLFGVGSHKILYTPQLRHALPAVRDVSEPFSQAYISGRSV
jgi:hypothetical protein